MEDATRRVVLDEPVKVNDGAIDAGRYGTYSYALQHKTHSLITHYQSFKPQ